MGSCLWSTTPLPVGGPDAFFSGLGFLELGGLGECECERPRFGFAMRLLSGYTLLERLTGFDVTLGKAMPTGRVHDSVGSLSSVDSVSTRKPR